MKKMIVALFALGFASSSVFADAKAIANGKFLFEDWGCKGCHSIGSEYNQDATKGPDLKGLYTRRKEEWIVNFTKNPQAMIDSGDKDAVEMFKKYNTVMKKFRISDAEWKDIHAFLKSKN